jgi:hypothetical protein
MSDEEVLEAEHDAMWCDRCGAYHSGECEEEEEDEE